MIFIYHESIEEDEKEYQELYGHLPSTREELVEYLLNEYKYDEEKINQEIKRITNIPWEEIKLQFLINPWATPRPRLMRNGGVFVKGASKHKKIIQKYIKNNRIIYTRTRFQVCVYQRTPKSANKMEKLLFEKGILRPLADPDWDNYGKTYSDMVQGILITNDNIISDGLVSKFYSIKPRIEIIIQFQTHFDCYFNERKTTHSKSYQNYVKEGDYYHE